MMKRELSSVRNMIEFAEKYDIKIEEKLLEEYIKENRFCEKNRALLEEYRGKEQISG